MTSMRDLFKPENYDRLIPMIKKREENGWEQALVAMVAGISNSWVCTCEKGLVRKISERFLAKYDRALKILSGEDPDTLPIIPNSNTREVKDPQWGIDYRRGKKTKPNVIKVSS